MKNDEAKIDRRQFISVSGAGLTSLFALSSGLLATADGQETRHEGLERKEPSPPLLPTRPYGRTGLTVSMLALGGAFDHTSNPTLLKTCLDWGLTYWDTADCYADGNSEIGIGKYFEKFPDARKKIFLVSKACSREPEELTRLLNRSLARLKTDYIDLYFLHAVNSPSELTPEMKTWGEKTKAQGKIKFFGCSTHGDMANVLRTTAGLGWIDGVMLSYNFRLMHEDAMKSAVEACHKAGVGLTAMKTQGGGPVRADSEAELALAGHFLQKGFTPHQAKLKAVWQNEAIASLCSHMPDLTILKANVAAAMDKTKLEVSDAEALKAYGKATHTDYCAGCRNLCEGAMGGDNRIADVMRYLMYHRNYGDAVRARALYAELPGSARSGIAFRDYSAAEKSCPRSLAIGRLMAEAERLLG